MQEGLVATASPSGLLVYAFLAGVSMAVLAIGLRLAAPGIHPALGIAIVTGIAFVVNVLVALAMRATTVLVVGFMFLKEPFTVTVCVTPGALILGCSFVTLSAATALSTPWSSRTSM